MKQKNAQVAFSLKGIKTEQFAIFEKNYSPKKETGLTTELQFKLDQTNKRIGVFLGFEFIQVNKVFIKIQVSCHFEIEKSSWQAFYQEKKIIIPRDFFAHLAMISTGTTRGVLFAKTEGTQFSTFIIPTLNVAEMIQEDATFDITE